MRLVRALSVAGLLRAAGPLAAFTAAAAAPTPAGAQPAADKATARTLATDGVKLFQAGKYAEALDRLQRAQSLYDAPIHLLYIARAQVKLDKLVEGAETYRRLQRVQLDAGAAAAQKQAVAAAGPELAELEPKIPALRLEVQPANLSAVEIRINGEKVSAAVLGIERPSNPGPQKVQVWAPGYRMAEANVDLRPGERKPVALQLEPDPAGGAAPPPVFPGAPEQPAPATEQAPAKPTPAAASDASKEHAASVESDVGTTRGGIGVLLGLRIGAAVPVGDVGNEDARYDGTLPLKDFAGTGGGIELRGGVRFAKYFTGLLYYARYALRPGRYWDDLVDDIPSNVSSENTAFAQELGLGAMIAFPRGKLGPFAELDLVYRSLQVDQELSAPIRCDASWTLSGGGVRLLGGVQIPLGKLLQLSPYAGVTLGPAPDEVKLDGNCDDSELEGLYESRKIDEPKLNGLFTIGVGGDFLIGKDTPD